MCRAMKAYPLAWQPFPVVEEQKSLSLFLPSFPFSSNSSFLTHKQTWVLALSAIITTILKLQCSARFILSEFSLPLGPGRSKSDKEPFLELQVFKLCCGTTAIRPFYWMTADAEDRHESHKFQPIYS